ncbi:hypothetical protein M5X11_19080 [Paenibacillus alginolyticus]|uniref:Uncharacterized protein n=1 Tax=Paenibacillus alginolyticus TaxID=59839 RepID=A0ABT4GHL3_9BACL|nr:hypothetical protein [Paenibacillus alginolyticus]MCY9667011.1 hypothetical protein [Paenibacillus alginolyticus]MCY9695544.1 hypothetical protein [Paenibacillus alginolyticus]MEC0142092.1 hypothetical protein [Paenibacillus alginolyticus]
MNTGMHDKKDLSAADYGVRGLGLGLRRSFPTSQLVFAGACFARAPKKTSQLPITA